MSRTQPPPPRHDRGTTTPRPRLRPTRDRPGRWAVRPQLEPMEDRALPSSLLIGGDGSAGVTSAPRHALNDVPTILPTVVGLRRFGFHRRPTRLVLSFNEELDPARAQDPRNYALTVSGPGRSLLIRGARDIALRRVIYNPIARTVTLWPDRPLSLRRSYTLVVNGTSPGGLADPAGTFLAGDGRPGTDAVMTFGREILSPAGPWGPGVPRPGGSAHVQTLYVSDYHNGRINRITSDGSVSTFVAGLDRPTGLAFHHADTLYVSEVGTGSILKITPRGRVTTFISGLNGPRDLAFDAAGHLYVSEVGTGSILKITPRGRVTKFVSGLSEPSGNVFDAAGHLYQSGFRSGTIVKITPGGRVFLFGSGLDEPEDLVVDRAGYLFEADFGSGRIHRIAPDGTVSVFVSGLSSPLGLAFDRTGTLHEADYGSGKIHRVAPDGTVTTFVSGLGGPAYLAFAPGPFDAVGHRLHTAASAMRLAGPDTQGHPPAANRRGVQDLLPLRSLGSCRGLA